MKKRLSRLFKALRDVTVAIAFLAASFFPAQSHYMGVAAFGFMWAFIYLAVALVLSVFLLVSPDSFDRGPPAAEISSRSSVTIRSTIFRAAILYGVFLVVSLLVIRSNFVFVVVYYIALFLVTLVAIWIRDRPRHGVPAQD